MSQPMQPDAATEPSPVDFATRVLGWMIDLAALWVLYAFISSELIPGLYSFVFNDNGLFSQSDAISIQLWRAIGIGAVFGLVAVGLMAVSLRTLVATPGQRLIGLLTADSESGSELSWPQAIGRSLMLYGPWMALLAVPTQLGLSLGSQDFGQDVSWFVALPWVVRVLAVAWYLMLAINCRSAWDGRGFHDLATRSVVGRAKLD